LSRSVLEAIAEGSMLVKLPYGKGEVKVEVPHRADVIVPREPPGVDDARAEIQRAMDRPTGSLRLRQLAVGRSDAVVVINDITRPAPSDLMLEEILRDLRAAGIREDEVTVLVAVGDHRANTPAEIRQMVGARLSSRLRIVNHDAEDEANLSLVGETGMGFPVWVNSRVAHASLVILTGVIAPHHGAGYSGGRKSLIPGVAGLRTIQRLHSLRTCPYGPAMGWLKGNPAHREMVAGARMVGIDFILNVVVNARGQVVRAIAGELEAAHEEGVSTCEAHWGIDVAHRYDIVVATPGGYPRDIDLHQSQKAMSVAEMLVDDGGTIVLIAECADGSGKFAASLMAAETPRQVIERFRREGFTRELSFKAFYCARALDEHAVIVACSGIERGDLERMFFRYAPSPQAAINEALKLKGAAASVLVLPYGVDCVPRVGG
jgi:nickel-dependent lactate racemase